MIGIIDSGSGGPQSLQPHTQYVQRPNKSFKSYGSMTDAELLSELYSHIDYLKSKNVADIYVGCFTLSCLIKKLRLDLPVHTMLDDLDLNSFDTIIATPYTCNYFNKTHQVISCPDLARQIEQNLEIRLPDINFDVKRLLLGCTHYYKIEDIINNKYKPSKIKVKIYRH